MTGPDPDPSGVSPGESASILIRNATIVTMNDRLDILTGDVVVRGGRIVSVGGHESGRHSKVIDAGGGYLLPGSSRRTSISVRRSSGAQPTTCRCSNG